MIKPACFDTYIIKRKSLGGNYFSLDISPFPNIKSCRPGHFVHIKIPSREILFRRPMSLADVSVENNSIQVIVKILGRGTSIMSNMRTGEKVSVLGPLGTPLTMPGKTKEIIMAAGGVGIPPLIYLAEVMIKKGFDPKKIMYLNAMADTGMGQGDYDKIKLLGSTLQQCQCKFKPADHLIEPYGLQS